MKTIQEVEQELLLKEYRELSEANDIDIDVVEDMIIEVGV